MTRTVTVVAYHEMGGRRLSDLYHGPNGKNLPPLYPHWHALQGPRGDRARSPLGFDDRQWRLYKGDSRYPQGWFVRKLSSATGHGLYIPSGNRYATVALLQDVHSGLVECFIGYHTVAHVNRGAHFGWTGRGPHRLLQLMRLGKPNPAVGCYKQGMENLEILIKEMRAAGYRVIPLGDWNFDAFADLRAMRAGNAEHYGPAETMHRCGVETVYARGKLTHGTDGNRGIDYAGISHAQPGGANILAAWTVSGRPSDHAIVVARVEHHVDGKSVTFDVATANIRATPPMLPSNVRKCIHHTVRLVHP